MDLYSSHGSKAFSLGTKELWWEAIMKPVLYHDFKWVQCTQTSVTAVGCSLLYNIIVAESD